MPKLNMESLLPFIEEAFNRGVDFQIPITGTSMNPLLYQNRDFVKIIKPVLPLKLGDIPLYRRDAAITQKTAPCYLTNSGSHLPASLYFAN